MSVLMAITVVGGVLSLIPVGVKFYKWITRPQIEIIVPGDPRSTPAGMYQNPELQLQVVNTGGRVARGITGRVNSIEEFGDGAWKPAEELDARSSWRLFIRNPRVPEESVDLPPRGTDEDDCRLVLVWIQGRQLRFPNPSDYHVTGWGIDHKKKTLPTTDYPASLYRVTVEVEDRDGHSAEFRAIVDGTGEDEVELRPDHAGDGAELTGKGAVP